MSDLIIKVKYLEHSISLPEYMTKGASGMDLPAACKDDIILYPGERNIIPTGLVLEIPNGFEGQVRPRSSLAIKHGITVLNSPGTIDCDYRGEVKVILVNTDNKTEYKIKRGDKIAQLVLCKVWNAKLKICDTLSETTRGKGGFGHTGR